MTLSQVEAIQQTGDAQLHAHWRHATEPNDIGCPEAAAGRLLAPIDLAYAETLMDLDLVAMPDADDAQIRAVALRRLTSSQDIFVEDDILFRLYRNTLERELHWIDLGRVRAAGLSATAILQTVCRHRNPELNNGSSLDARLHRQLDVIIDETALIYDHAHTAPHLASQYPSIQSVRARLVVALVDEWQDAALGQALIPSSPIAPVNTIFWYDGIEIKNALNQTAANIADTLFDSGWSAMEYPQMQKLIDAATRNRLLPGQPHGPITTVMRSRMLWDLRGNLEKTPRYVQRPGAIPVAGVWLTRDEMIAIVEQTMRSLMLDTHYPAGTVLNAIATVVGRLAPQHGVHLDRYDDAEQLVMAYNSLLVAWADDPHFPFSPAACVARLLAKVNGVLLEQAPSDRSHTQQIARQLVDDMSLTLSMAWPPSEIQWWLAVLAAIAEDPLSDLLPVIGLTAFSGGSRGIYDGLRRNVLHLKHATETIFYTDAADLERQLGLYLTQRMQALAPLPVYDEDFRIEQILRLKLGMSDHDLAARRMTLRKFPLEEFGITGYLDAREETPMEEFKRKSMQFFSEMHFGGKLINASKERIASRNQAVERMANHSVVRAKAMELLRRYGLPLGDAEILRLATDMARRIAGLPPRRPPVANWLDVYNTLFGNAYATAIADAFVSGEVLRIAGLLPFVVPAYDVAEGIRLADAQRALGGAIHLGADAISFAAGCGLSFGMKKLMANGVQAAEKLLAARRLMSPAERAGVDMMRVMDLEAPREHRRRAVAGAPDNAEDTFDVFRRRDSLSDTSPLTTPKRRLSLIAPKLSVTQHTLFLIDQKRTVPVTAVGDGTFAELNTRGNVKANEPLIFGDLALGRGYRLVHDFGRTAASAITREKIMTRKTVTDVLRYWQRIGAVPNIRQRRTHFIEMIDSLFPFVEHSVYPRFIGYWRKLYARSDTAVVVINAAYDQLLYRDGAEITFDSPKANVCGNAICFLSDAARSTVSYASVDGAIHMQSERMWVHEVMHWAAGTADVSSNVAHNHRGATIYMTDKILTEAGAYPPIPTRVAYRLPPAFSESEATCRGWLINIQELSRWALAEDRILDATLDVDRPFSPATRVIGKDVARRVTVRQGLALNKVIHLVGRSAAETPLQLYERALSIFRMGSAAAHRRLFRLLVVRSKTFRHITRAWAEITFDTRVEIRFFDFSKRRRMAGRPLLSHTFFERFIGVNQQKIYYFSEEGLSELSPLRRHAGMLTDFFIRELIPDEHALVLSEPLMERGLAVLLENEVLKQAGDKSSPRICAGLTTNADNFLRYQSAVSRAADSENGYLRQVTQSGTADNILGLSATIETIV